MLKNLGYAVAATLVVAGCAQPVTGVPQSAPRCLAVGYEDLVARDSACAERLRQPDAASGWTLRHMDVAGQPVRYMIHVRKLGLGPPVAMSDKTVEIRSYAHYGIHSVERERLSDIVHVYASDDCLVEGYVASPSPDIRCDIQSIATRSVDEADARVLLPRAMVDDVEMNAFNSGRTAKYALTVITHVSS